ncbi:MAG TPA: response regulator [Nitrososphaeraceae archaeon]
MRTRQELARHSLPSKNFASIGGATTTRAIALALSIAIVLFEVLPMSNMASATTTKMTRIKINTISSSPSSTIKLLKTMNAAKANHVVTSYTVRWNSDEHIIIVVSNLSSRANIGRNNNGTNFGTERHSYSCRDGKKFIKRILVVDDEPDIVFAFKMSLNDYYYDDKRGVEVYTYNNPLEALSDFKPHFYDLLLVDVYMPCMNGFEVSQKILEVDPDIGVCFISAAEVNIEALMELYPKEIFGCFIKKPVEIEYLAERLRV